MWKALDLCSTKACIYRVLGTQLQLAWYSDEIVVCFLLTPRALMLAWGRGHELMGSCARVRDK
jgi:hypothetical protein